MKRLDLTGRKFGHLKWIEEAPPHIIPCGQSQRCGLWECDCGTQITARNADVINGHTASCGCIKLISPLRISLVGQQFGKWHVLADAPSRTKPGGSASTYSLCRCECGFIGEISNSSLRAGISRGCVQCGLASTAKAIVKHGHCKPKKRTLTYRIWCGMITRCTNPKCKDWKRYGGDGVLMWQPWQDSFQAFVDYNGECPPGMEIDRYPNKTGNYEPGNVRWATRTQQNRNRIDNRIMTIRGITGCLSELIEHFQVNQGRVTTRLHRGWPPEQAFFAPKNTKLKSLLAT